MEKMSQLWHSSVKDAKHISGTQDIQTTYSKTMKNLNYKEKIIKYQKEYKPERAKVVYLLDGNIDVYRIEEKTKEEIYIGTIHQ